METISVQHLTTVRHYSFVPEQTGLDRIKTSFNNLLEMAIMSPYIRYGENVAGNFQASFSPRKVPGLRRPVTKLIGELSNASFEVIPNGSQVYNYVFDHQSHPEGHSYTLFLPSKLERHKPLAGTLIYRSDEPEFPDELFQQVLTAITQIEAV
jgi:hypothetical protein